MTNPTPPSNPYVPSPVPREPAIVAALIHAAVADAMTTALGYNAVNEAYRIRNEQPVRDENDYLVVRARLRDTVEALLAPAPPSAIVGTYQGRPITEPPPSAEHLLPMTAVIGGHTVQFEPATRSIRTTDPNATMPAPIHYGRQTYYHQEGTGETGRVIRAGTTESPAAVHTPEPGKHNELRCSGCGVAAGYLHQPGCPVMAAAVKASMPQQPAAVRDLIARIGSCQQCREAQGLHPRSDAPARVTIDEKGSPFTYFQGCRQHADELIALSKTRGIA